ncbi:MAG: hypothetical protein CSA70_00330 [Rhodobacterales bacterium]|nr:MAG: hypothetical protein CSA70_00330 [Rhodobacterales bacterium]
MKAAGFPAPQAFKALPAGAVPNGHPSAPSARISASPALQNPLNVVLADDDTEVALHQHRMCVEIGAFATVGLDFNAPDRLGDDLVHDFVRDLTQGAGDKPCNPLQ